jgi:uncharacterized protein (TIGR02452 family)
MTRLQRARVAQETLAICERGTYSAAGQTISIGEQLAQACAGTVLYRLDDYDTLMNAVAQLPRYDTEIVVSARSTLAAGRSLAERFAHVACLNFASARHPGGGFIGGSQAQEESLARASGLYATLQTQPAFYEYHHYNPSALYSDHMILSPHVPVFRDDQDRLILQPWTTTFLTAAAVNAGVLRRNDPTLVPQIEPTMQRRARMVLAMAAHHGCEALVLGAWGCGVFKNNPTTIARIFADALADPALVGLFKAVDFAIYDSMEGQPILRAFRSVFEG